MSGGGGGEGCWPTFQLLFMSSKIPNSLCPVLGVLTYFPTFAPEFKNEKNPQIPCVWWEWRWGMLTYFPTFVPEYKIPNSLCLVGGGVYIYLPTFGSQFKNDKMSKSHISKNGGGGGGGTLRPCYLLWRLLYTGRLPSSFQIDSPCVRFYQPCT